MTDLIHISDELQLTAFQPGDQEHLVRYMNDAELYRNTLTIPSPYTELHAENKLLKNQANLAQYGMHIDWAIRHRSHGLIGGITVFMLLGLEGHRDEVGYWLAAPFRGQGILTQVLRAFVAWQFEQRPSLVRLEALVFAHNPASARVLEKSGFQREGYLRKYDWKDGASLDAIIFSTLRGGQSANSTQS